MTFPTFEKEVQEDLMKFGILPYPLSDEFKSHVQPHQQFIYSTSKAGMVNKVVCIKCNALYNQLPKNINSVRFHCLFCDESLRLYMTSLNELITKTDVYERVFIDTVIINDSIIKELNKQSLAITLHEYDFKLDLTDENYGERKEIKEHSFLFTLENNKFSILYDNKEANMYDLCKLLNFNVFKKVIKLLSTNEEIKKIFGKSILVRALIDLDGTFATRFVDVNLDYYYKIKNLNLFETFYLEKIPELKESIKKIFLVKSITMNEIIEFDNFIKKYTSQNLEGILTSIFNYHTSRNSILFTILCFNRDYVNFNEINEWNECLDPFTNRKSLFVDMIVEREDFKPTVLNEYIDYLVQYEALTRSKAVTNYVAYIKKQMSKNIINFELYPKDILLKI